jgi:hypothetical protein
MCSQNSGPFPEFSEKNKYVNFLHGNIKILTRVGLILTKNSLFWIVIVFPTVLVHNISKKQFFKISYKNNRNFENLKYKNFMNQNCWKHNYYPK